MLKLIRRYGYRFATNSAYRKYIFQLLRERSAPSASAEAFHLSKINDFSNLRGAKLFMCGGCELTFIGDHLGSVGMDVYHTFENGRTAEPMIEVNDANSVLYAKSFDYVIFCQTQSFMQLTKKIFAAGGAYTEAERQADFSNLIAQLRIAIEAVTRRVICPIFLVSHFYFHGRYSGAHSYKVPAATTSYEEINLKYSASLYEIARSYPNVYILDVNRIFEVEGKKGSLVYDERSGVFDHPTKYGSRLIAEEALYQFEVLNPKNKRVKCAVFDLDNTLWRGVLREDGVGNLYPAWAHLHVLEALASRGILLAVVSKNDPEEASQVEQILGKPLFDKLVSVKLNWNPKSSNIKQIANELNIGIDAIAFFDDNPVEREEVRVNAPGVVVFDDKQIMAALDTVMFEPIGVITEESTTRTQMYKEQAKRAAAEATVDPSNISDFFKSCRFKLEIVRPTVAMTGRIEELIQRTNQLNATGKRTTQSEVQRYLNDQEQFYVSTASLQDKFGDYGLIGVCIAQRVGSNWDVIEFDFSCRAMGKHVEQAMLTHLCLAVREARGDTVTIQFKKTTRNAEMRSILQNYGFSALNETDQAIQLRFLVDRDSFAYPEWFDISMA